MKPIRYQPKKPRNQKRDERIRYSFFYGGIPMIELARIHNITAARVHQIIHGRASNDRR